MDEIKSKRSHTFDNIIERAHEKDSDDYIVTAAIASETPVLRSFGYEVLSMRAENLDLKFLNSGRAPVLWQHDQHNPIGVIESVKLSEDGILRAKLRLSKSEQGTRIFNDIQDGILSNISIGYAVKEFEDTSHPDSDIPVFRSTMTEIYEASIVSIPADAEAYIGRSKVGEEPLEKSEASTINNITEQNTLPKTQTQEIKSMDDNTKTETRTVDASAIADMYAMAREHNMVDLADKMVREGKSIYDLQRAVLDTISKRTAETKVEAIDLNGAEREYSLSRALQAAASGDWSRAGLEKEVSNEIANLRGASSPGFFLPMDALRVLTSGGTGTGAEMVGTVHRDDLMINPIFNQSVAVAAGARVLDGLQGDYDIPGMGSVSAGWVAENADGSEVTPSTFARTLTPRTIAAFTKYSRRNLMQSSPSIDALLVNLLRGAAGQALDTAVFHGTGANNQPTGIINTTGVGVEALATNGAAISHTALANMQKLTELGNIDGTAYITNPKVKAALLTTPKVASTDSVMLMQGNNELMGYNFYNTNNIFSNLTKGTGTNLSAIFYGDFSQVYIGQWGDVEIELSNSDGTDFRSAQKTIRMMMDADVTVANPAGLSVIKDIIA